MNGEEDHRWTFLRAPHVLGFLQLKIGSSQYLMGVSEDMKL